MTYDRTEQLIRDSFHDEAARAVDSREVLANVRRQKPRRSYGLVLATAAAVVVVAAVATFVVPEVFQRSNGQTPPVGDQQEQTSAVTPTNVLVVGDDGHGYTDSIVLTQVSADGSVNLVSLPRDSQVTTPTGVNKLNQVYRESGPDALLTTVRELTGVAVDHYAVVAPTAVGELVNAVGGVEVCLNSAVSDPYSGAEFPAGQQVISGDAALAFIRQRYDLPNGDLDRMVRLQAFLQSLAVKVRDGDMKQVVAAVQGKVQTDQNLDLLGLAEDLAGATALRVGTVPIVGEEMDSHGAVLVVDPAQVKQFVTDLPSTPPVTGDVPCVN